MRIVNNWAGRVYVRRAVFQDDQIRVERINKKQRERGGFGINDHANGRSTATSHREVRADIQRVAA